MTFAPESLSQVKGFWLQEIRGKQGRFRARNDRKNAFPPKKKESLQVQQWSALLDAVTLNNS